MDSNHYIILMCLLVITFLTLVNRKVILVEPENNEYLNNHSTIEIKDRLYEKDRYLDSEYRPYIFNGWNNNYPYPYFNNLYNYGYGFPSYGYLFR